VHLLEHYIHQALERCRRVGDLERHDEELEVPMVRPERRLLDVIWVDAHLVVTDAQATHL
jgi:hypothetical protein